MSALEHELSCPYDGLKMSITVRPIDGVSYVHARHPRIDFIAVRVGRDYVSQAAVRRGC